jgi:hypothetical protein
MRLRSHQRHGLAGAAGLAREVAQLARDAPHAVGQLGHALQVDARGLGIAALQETLAVAGQRAQRRQRLVELMGHARGQLADHGQLAGLHQFILGTTQRGLGMDALGHLGLQRLVGGRQVGRALLHLALQFVMRGLQRLARGQAVAQVAAALVDHHGQQQHEGGSHGGSQCTALGQLVHLFQMGEHGQRPGRAGQRARLGQEAAADGVDRTRRFLAMVNFQSATVPRMTTPFSSLTKTGASTVDHDCSSWSRLTLTTATPSVWVSSPSVEAR